MTPLFAHEPHHPSQHLSIQPSVLFCLPLIKLSNNLYNLSLGPGFVNVHISTISFLHGITLVCLVYSFCFSRSRSTGLSTPVQTYTTCTRLARRANLPRPHVPTAPFPSRVFPVCPLAVLVILLQDLEWECVNL